MEQPASSASLRAIQIGSWWETITASWPAAAWVASLMASRIRATISLYGSPQVGFRGLRKYHQVRGFRSAPSRETFRPSR